jgi:outer membrane receptor protein involved in Fe transport
MARTAISNAVRSILSGGSGLRRPSLALAALGACLYVGAAFADAADDQKLDQERTKSPDTSQGVTILGRRVIETSIPMEKTSAVATVKAEEIERLVPTSPLDLLANVPGVYVDTSQGVVSVSSPVSATIWTPKGNYFSRGLAFIQIEEDGLPVEGAAVFGVEQLLRSDLTLGSLEVLRGGSAAVSAANAPGGLFNYVSKVGGDELQSTARVRYGRQGDGQFPYYRGEVNVNGPLGAPGWYFNVGGYYQRDYGARDAGFPLDRGGQFKANVVRSFEHGSIMLYGKYLNDHNGYSQAVPMTNWSKPRPVAGWSTTSTPHYQPVKFQVRTGPNDFTTYDFAGNMVGTTQSAIGIKSDFEFGTGWSVHGNVRYSNNNGRWDGPGQGSAPGPITDTLIPGFTNFYGIPGITTYTDRLTGRTAQVESLDGRAHTLLNYDLPTTPGSVPNAVMFQGANIQELHTKEFVGKLSLEKKLDRMQFALGTYLDYADAGYYVWGPFGASLYQPNPRMLDIRHQMPDGTVLQITNPEGFSEGILRNTNEAIWKQISGYFAYNWQIADDWTFDAGVRHEYVKVNSANALFADRIFVSEDPATRYDNSYLQLQPAHIVDRSIGTTSWTAAISHDFTREQSLYLRYARGKKSPDYGFYQSIWDAPTDNLTPTIPQDVTQIELGYGYDNGRVRLNVTPYYSRLSVAAAAILYRPDPKGGPFTEPYLAYTPANVTDDYGIEIDGSARFGAGFSVRAAFTYQRSHILKSYQFLQPNGPGPIDEALLAEVNVGNDAELVPNVMATITPSYSRGPLYAQLQWLYTGNRPANNYDAWVLPRFDQVNLDLSWQFAGGLQAAVNVNNLLNSQGIMQWAPPGGLDGYFGRTGFTREAVAALPDAVFAGLTVPSRAYFVSLTYRF